MSEQHELTDPDAVAPDVPVTGNAQVDRAVASVADLADLSVAEQHERLVAAHETLHRALDAEDEPPADQSIDRLVPPAGAPGHP